MQESALSFLRRLRSALRPLKLLFADAVSELKYRLLRLFQSPQKPKEERLLIHLGCGFMDDKRYTNVDGVPFPHVHHVGPVEELPQFKGNSADLVYACHVLEHIAYPEMNAVLREWRRVLKEGGILRISVPDFDKLIAIYSIEEKKIDSMIAPLMGAQEDPYGFHKTIFNETYLTDLLKKAGFREVRVWDPKTASDYSFDDWAGKLVNGHPISLNLEGVK